MALWEEFGGVRVDAVGFDAAGFIDEDKHVKVMPASAYKPTTHEWRATLGHYHSAFVLPTDELVAWLKLKIGGRSAIEIGSGNGVLAKALGIPATDSYLWELPEVQLAMAQMHQPTQRYGKHVEKLAAEQAVDKHRPQVVIASWIVHPYADKHPERKGSMYAPNEGYILDNCEAYIHVGNRDVHRFKPLLSRPHETIRPDWLYSRAFNKSPDEIRVWINPKRAPS